MQSQLTDYAKKFNPDGTVPRGMDPALNPFVREGNKTTCRFDAIEITEADDAFGGTIVGYRWKGQAVMEGRVLNFKRSDPGNSLLLSGLEGVCRVEYDFT